MEGPPRFEPFVAAGQPEGVQWARHLDALKRNALLIAAIMVTGAVASFFVMRRVSPVYEAQATVWVNNTSRATQQSGPLSAPGVLTSVSWVDLLRSFAIVDPVVRDLKLNLHYRGRDSQLFRDFSLTPKARFGAYTLTVAPGGRSYQLANASGVIVERGTVGDSIGRQIGVNWLPDARLLNPARPIEFSFSAPRATSLSLVTSVRATLPEEGQVLKITLSGTDPVRTAHTVNAWAGELVNASGDLKQRHLREFKSILGIQLGLADQQLRAAENDLERFRVNTITLPRGAAAGIAGQGDPIVAGYFQQKAALDELRSERVSLERILLDAGRGPINTQAFLQLPAILNNAPQLRAAIEELSMRQATLRTERQFLTDENPRVKQVAEAVRVLETETIPTITRAVLNSLRAAEPQLGSRIDQGSQELRAIPARATEEMRLARRVAAAENLYSSLKARYEEVSIAELQTTADLTVLDTAAVPTAPTSDEAPRLGLIALLASLGVAVSLALLKERLDPRFRYPEQATYDLGLSIAGTVPSLRTRRNGEYQVAMMSQAAESFRTLRLAIRYDFPGTAPIVLSVSSPAAADGKSLISGNLGLAFASTGNRTLIIDGDVRRGTLHSTFDAPVTPGLVDYLHGQASVDSILRSTSSPNLFLIPRGTRRSRAPELLVSDVMSNLVQAMRSEFDVIIIDSPPLSAGIDAYALGAAAGSMLIVLRQGVTDRKLAAAKLAILDRLPVRLLGAVINAVPVGGAYRYYNADYSYKNGTSIDQIVDLATPKGLVVHA